jgi:hypothetical protein
MHLGFQYNSRVEEIRRGPAVGPAGDGCGAVQGLLGIDFDLGLARC